jgi:serine/threonine protein kinase
MPWPEPASYAAMLQNPKVAFKDSVLQKAKLARDGNNQLLGLSGQFAVVWPANLPDGRKVAVRTFSSDRPGRREYYRAVSDFLSGRTWNSLVPFKYQEKAVRASDGKLYPAIIMDWVDGWRLDQWLQAKCREGNRKDLAAAADKWLELVSELEDAKICHGDLAPDNILVTGNNEFKLVDYDCLGVPPLFGQANPETGTLPYQHPERDPVTPLSPVPTQLLRHLRVCRAASPGGRAAALGRTRREASVRRPLVSTSGFQVARNLTAVSIADESA